MPDSQGWIAVEDAIPESGERVLGYWSEKRGGSYWSHMQFVVYMWETDQWSLEYDKFNIESLPITYWQPLPSVPDRVKPPAYSG